LSIIETIAVFVGIPAAVVLIVFGLVYAGGPRSGSRRYRPGRPYHFTPVWFLAAPEQHGAATGNGRAVSGANRPALTKGGTPDTAAVQPASAAARPDATGGASDRW
jgi:hypothetical protein